MAASHRIWAVRFPSATVPAVPAERPIPARSAHPPARLTDRSWPRAAVANAGVRDSNRCIAVVPSDSASDINGKAQEEGARRARPFAPSADERPSGSLRLWRQGTGENIGCLFCDDPREQFAPVALVLADGRACERARIQFRPSEHRCQLVGPALGRDILPESGANWQESSHTLFRCREL